MSPWGGIDSPTDTTHVLIEKAEDITLPSSDIGVHSTMPLSGCRTHRRVDLQLMHLIESIHLDGHRLSWRRGKVVRGMHEKHWRLYFSYRCEQALAQFR